MVKCSCSRCDFFGEINAFTSKHDGGKPLCKDCMFEYVRREI